LHKANYTADDKTITTIASLIANVGSPAAKKSAVSAEFGLVEIERVRAFHRFDLGVPGVDQQVAAFLDQHMNGCNECCQIPEATNAPCVRPPESAQAGAMPAVFQGDQRVRSAGLRR
jgi:hypothetical protein